MQVYSPLVFLCNGILGAGLWSAVISRTIQNDVDNDGISQHSTVTSESSRGSARHWRAPWPRGHQPSNVSASLLP